MLLAVSAGVERPSEPAPPQRTAQRQARPGRRASVGRSGIWSSWSPFLARTSRHAPRRSAGPAAGFFVFRGKSHAAETRLKRPSSRVTVARSGNRPDGRLLRPPRSAHAPPHRPAHKRAGRPGPVGEPRAVAPVFPSTGRCSPRPLGQEPLGQEPLGQGRRPPWRRHEDAPGCRRAGPGSCASTAAATWSAARRKRFQMNGPCRNPPSVGVTAPAQWRKHQGATG